MKQNDEDALKYCSECFQAKKTNDKADGEPGIPTLDEAENVNVRNESADKPALGKGSSLFPDAKTNEELARVKARAQSRGHCPPTETDDDYYFPDGNKGILDYIIHK